jgi:hypothetical protein
MKRTKIEIAAKNQRSITKILKPEAVHGQAQMHPYRPKNLMRQSL